MMTISIASDRQPYLAALDFPRSFRRLTETGHVIVPTSDEPAVPFLKARLGSLADLNSEGQSLCGVLSRR